MQQCGGVFEKIGGCCHRNGVHHIQFEKGQTGANQNRYPRKVEELLGVYMAKARACASGRYNNPYQGGREYNVGHEKKGVNCKPNSVSARRQTMII